MTLTLIQKDHLVDNVWAFKLQPSEPLSWTAGQYVQVELPHDHPDAEGTKRWFTNSAAPYEGILQITTRVTISTFKQTLDKLALGSTDLKLLAEPDGDFVWRDQDKPLIFVAGGIGITPYRSILAQRAHDKLPLDVTLIYGGRTADLPFKDELTALTGAHTGLKVHYVLGDPLSAQAILGLVPDLADHPVYVSGPEPMVEALGEDLKSHSQSGGWASSK